LSLVQENINAQSFKTWFLPIKPIKLEEANLTVQVPSQFFYDWIEGHYSELLLNALSQILGDGAKLTYSVVVNQKSYYPPPFPPVVRRKPTDGVDLRTNLSDRYTFENFVEGGSNQLARAAALAVAEAPGKTRFNPLVVYGGVGLGKTHLIQAIGNFALAQGTAKRVAYVSSEKFTIEFINAIQNNKATEFSGFYRSVDLLLVDDIQFFINKERTQEEFFHTFNALHQAGKQIVLTSDRPPNDLKGMEERLISRFQWGLVADIQAPDLETRIAILQKKAEENGVDLPPEVVQLIATNVKTNIRELEGSLIRLLAYSSLMGRDITLDLAKEVLKDFGVTTEGQITIEGIQRIVAEHFDLPEDMMRAKSRKKEVAFARQVAMYLCKEVTKHSLKTIGLHFGGRDHSTVIHALQTIERSLQEDDKLQETIRILRRKIDLSER